MAINGKIMDRIEKEARNNKELETALFAYRCSVEAAWEVDTFCANEDMALKTLRRADHELLIAAANAGLVKIKKVVVKMKKEG